MMIVASYVLKRKIVIHNRGKDDGCYFEFEPKDETRFEKNSTTIHLVRSESGKKDHYDLITEKNEELFKPDHLFIG